MLDDLAGCFSLIFIIVGVALVGSLVGWVLLYLASFLIPVEVTLWNGFILFGIIWILKGIFS